MRVLLPTRPLTPAATATALAGATPPTNNGIRTQVWNEADDAVGSEKVNGTSVYFFSARPLTIRTTAAAETPFRPFPLPLYCFLEGGMVDDGRLNSRLNGEIVNYLLNLL